VVSAAYNSKDECMAREEEDVRPPRPAFAIGQPLELMSVAKIDLAIEKLREEIARLEAARAAKQAASTAAEAFFKK
jgi:uncharacterized small protein (DUF1192 family)